MQEMKTYIVQFEINFILNNHVGGVACKTIAEWGWEMSNNGYV